MLVELRNFSRAELLQSGGVPFNLPPDLEPNLERLAIALQSLRNWWKRPITITSGYRSLDHNRKIGGVEGSLHTKAMAVDCYSEPFLEFIDFCKKFWPGGVISYAGHVHLDLGSYFRGSK